MTTYLRISVIIALLLTMAVPAVSQNSSLMRVSNADAGRNAGNNSHPGIAPSTIPDVPNRAGAASVPSIVASARPDRVAQLGPLPYQNLANEIDGSGSDNGGSNPYDPNSNVAQVPYNAAPGYDPYQRNLVRPVISLDEASWTYEPAPPMRVIRKNDVVTIRVDEITRMMAEGAAQQRKRTLSEVILTDWIRLTNFRLRPDPQENGDPAAAVESNENYRAQGFVQSRESLTFNIAATVVDIRSNGNLVLEARKAIRVNDNLWETSLSGMCRAEDIGPDNVVLSKDLIDLEIRKEDRGHLRDTYSRGWLKRFLDRFGPF